MQTEDFARLLQGKPRPAKVAAVGRWVREGGPQPPCVRKGPRRAGKLLERDARARAARVGGPAWGGSGGISSNAAGSRRRGSTAAPASCKALRFSG